VSEWVNECLMTETVVLGQKAWLWAFTQRQNQPLAHLHLATSVFQKTQLRQFVRHFDKAAADVVQSLTMASNNKNRLAKQSVTETPWHSGGHGTLQFICMASQEHDMRPTTSDSTYYSEMIRQAVFSVIRCAHIFQLIIHCSSISPHSIYRC